ncbi:sodium:proton antiporter [Terrilactibacillus sp. BCM23-1]|uniref:Sodium:proton antiporter n=1 Tax=Terrilactibacillus tamarindi TaxID=2599694 RepID=A0A6N8CLW9_9BACI|nr:monovalent cation:proton antiporter family protein [Terrilactibacillus tamarindi]MTT30588.1 sodium:proton antiporter [Terrilactibacillus tamarindi]
MHSTVTSLVVVLLAALVTPILLTKFKLNIIPVVVAEIIAGLIIGKSGFNLVGHGAWIDTLSTLGFIFLMFLSGVEIDFSVFTSSGNKKKEKGRKTEPNGLVISSLVFLAILVISFIISVILVLVNLTSNYYFMTLVISTISLGVVMPTLKEAKLMKTSVGQIILLITVIADLVTMVLLSVFVSFYDKSSGGMGLLLILFVVGVVIYFIAKTLRHRTFFESLSKGTVQIGMRAIFALIILLVGLSETVGAENILGAFLAGVLVSLLSPNREMVQQLDSFGYGFLIPIFFVMIGVDLDIWKLFSDFHVLLMIPVLFVGLLVSKLIPVLILKKWYDWRTVIGSGFLLTSTLSLVVAAAKVGERIHVIDNKMSSALILLAVVSCIITPVVFRKVFPKTTVDKKKRIVFIGANRITLPLSLEMNEGSFETRIYHTKLQKLESNEDDTDFDVIELENYDERTLEKAGCFAADILVASTGVDDTNAIICKQAKERGINRIVSRIESPELMKELQDEGIDTFSTYFSIKSVLKAIIQSPDLVKLLNEKDNGLYSLKVNNREIVGPTLRRLPFLGDLVVVRIYRGRDSILPQGDTRIRVGDRLVVTGSKEHVDKLRERLE